MRDSGRAVTERRRLDEDNTSPKNQRRGFSRIEREFPRIHHFLGIAGIGVCVRSSHPRESAHPSRRSASYAFEAINLGDANTTAESDERPLRGGLVCETAVEQRSPRAPRPPSSR